MVSIQFFFTIQNIQNKQNKHIVYILAPITNKKKTKKQQRKQQKQQKQQRKTNAPLSYLLFATTSVVARNFANDNPGPTPTTCGLS